MSKLDEYEYLCSEAVENWERYKQVTHELAEELKHKNDINYWYNEVDKIYEASWEPEPTGKYAEQLKHCAHEMVRILMHKEEWENF